MIEEAARFVVDCERAKVPVEQDRLQKWLGFLGTLCAGAGSVQDAKAKTKAYSVMLSDYPAYLFTKETLHEIAMKNKWMTYKDVCDVLDAKRSELNAKAFRAKQIANHRNDDEEWTPPTTEEKETVSKMVADFLKGHKINDDIQQPSVVQKEPMQADL